MKGNALRYREARRPHGRGFLKSIIAVTMLSIGVASFTGVVAIKPTLMGTWFTLYEEHDDTNLIYKVEVRVVGVHAENVRAAVLDIEVRVTNNHPFDIYVHIAEFVALDLNKNKYALRMSFHDETILRGPDPTSIMTKCMFYKVIGFGVTYLVQGTIKWSETHDSGTPTAGPFTTAFSEVHSIKEFIHK